MKFVLDVEDGNALDFAQELEKREDINSIKFKYKK